MARIDVVLDDKRLRQLAKEMQASADQIVRAVAFAVEGEAKVKAPVDTSALRNSIYTETDRGGYANGRPLNGGLPDLRLPATNKAGRVITHIEQGYLPKPKNGEAHVGPSVEYGLFVELGANGRAANPYLETAVTNVARSGAFQRAVRDVLKDYE